MDLKLYQHPAIFPEKLVADHIISWSNEGDIVLDPFMGSGTTAKKAIELNRRWMGIEISKYVLYNIITLTKNTHTAVISYMSVFSC